MRDFEIKGVESRMGPGTEFGGAELVSDAVVSWLLGGHGGLKVFVTDNQGQPHVAVLTFKQFRGFKKDRRDARILRGNGKVEILHRVG